MARCPPPSTICIHRVPAKTDAQGRYQRTKPDATFCVQLLRLGGLGIGTEGSAPRASPDSICGIRDCSCGPIAPDARTGGRLS